MVKVEAKGPEAASKLGGRTSSSNGRGGHLRTRGPAPRGEDASRTRTATIEGPLCTALPEAARRQRLRRTWGPGAGSGFRGSGMFTGAKPGDGAGYYAVALGLPSGRKPGRWVVPIGATIARGHAAGDRHFRWRGSSSPRASAMNPATIAPLPGGPRSSSGLYQMLYGVFPATGCGYGICMPGSAHRPSGPF